jgi:hypothetical protein
MTLLPIFLLGLVQAFQEHRKFFLVETQVDEFVLHHEVFFFAVVQTAVTVPWAVCFRARS